MAKTDLIKQVNSALDLGLAEDTELNVSQLEAIEKVAEEASTRASRILELEADIQELNKALAESESNSKTVSDNPVVKVGRKEYQVIGSLRSATGVLSKEEIAEDEKLVASLVEKGSGLIVELQKN